ncbi:MAG: response regulator transcription factor [Oscillospiraceae bacterium]|nr:response regulator transcription factor [Oscillospiraceae bacterium]
MYKIFIVEDDPTISSVISKMLSSWGNETVCAKDFTHVFEEFCECVPSLILMDIYLPFYNGFYWCSRIRSVSKIPIIFISSASDNMNIVTAINMGGDDFISKPFDLDVLAAKVNAVLRRAYSFSVGTHLIEAGGAVLDTGSASLLIGKDRVELTKNEFRILSVLMENKGRTVSRSDLIAKLWETDSFIDDNTLTVNINRLRKKLSEHLPNEPELIKTRKGSGYIIENDK